MKIRAGYEIIFECPNATPMLLMISVHPSRKGDLLTPQNIAFDPPIPAEEFTDMFGNASRRVVAPAGPFKAFADFIIADSGLLDDVAPAARQFPVAELPLEALPFLLGSRYCETDRLSDIAWSLFGTTPEGWSRVAAICTFVHNHLTFGYQYARNTRSAWEAYQERLGVCRDFAHLAVTFCRCMNIPARYCTGYLGDIGVPPDPAPMDFSAWFDVFLGGRWYTFDARHNHPRIGRILMGTGRDAADVALTTSFGRMDLVKFLVISDEVVAA